MLKASKPKHGNSDTPRIKALSTLTAAVYS